MAEPTTWTELKANLADWLDRTDLTVQIPEFIGYAERKFNRVLRVPEMEESVTSSTSAATITLPSDFLAIKSLYINGDSDLTLLRQLSLDQLRYEYDGEETGTPEFFAMQSGTDLIFAPAPTESIAYVLNYYQKLPQLGASQASNWLLAAHPDLYVAQSLVEAMIFLRDSEGLSIWEQRASRKLDELSDLGRRKALGENRARLRSNVPLSASSFNINRGY
jgi:hypothetical protein